VPLALPLVALDVLVLALWVIAAALAIALIMRKVGALFRTIPVVGSYIAGAADAVAQAVTNAAGTLEHGIDALIGASWHLLSRFTDKLWQEIESHSVALHEVSSLVARLVSLYHHIRVLASHAISTVEHVPANLRSVTRSLSHLAHRVKVLEHDVGKGIGEDVLPRIKSLDRELTHLERKVIPKIRAEAQAAENEVGQLTRYIADNFVGNATADIEAAVAIGLGALGLSGLRCDSNPFKNNPNACGLWNDLSSLLGLVGLVAGAMDFETLVHAAQDLTGAAVSDFEDVFGL
jgi:hypothetical protein